ncbi:MAG: hypothetical protein ACRDL4_14755 [Thermoleophilaceae bacterium]
MLSAAAFALPATGQAQAPPVNDNYLQSAPLNQPNSRLERRDTLRDVQNTFNASVQGDVFNPPQSGGPPELTSCGGAGYGKTVWYDIYPDVNGLIRLRANGYDTVLAVVPFNPNTARPRFDEALCSNASSGLAEEYLVKVKGGDSYSIQVGGVNGAGGALEFLFDFLADSDGDGVLNAEDRCDRLDGTQRNGGCPRPARGDASLRARPTANGIQLLGLTVRAPRRSRVVVRCSRGCRRYVKRARRRGRVRFGALRGRQLRAGTKLDIRITRRDSFGTFIRYRVLRGNFKKIERCMNPGSSRPRRSCG